MPFKEINVEKIIEHQRSIDPDFKEAWDSSRMEYSLIGQLTAIRKQKELSQRDLAERINKSQQAVSRVENREINPSLKMICNMADSLGYELKLVPKAR